MRIHHVALRVADVDRAAAFYTGVFGLPVVRRQEDAAGPRSAWLDAGGTVLMLERRLAGTGSETGSAHLLALDARSPDAALDPFAVWESRLADAGVPVDDRTPHTLYCRDPDGHRVGLSVHPLATDE
jgi:hypothetical protein